MGEVVYLDGAEGSLDDLWYYTIGGAVVFGGKYNIAVCLHGTAARRDSGTMISKTSSCRFPPGVELRNGWALDGAYKYHVEENVDNHTIGFLLAKTFEFDTRNR